LAGLALPAVLAGVEELEHAESSRAPANPMAIPLTTKRRLFIGRIPLESVYEANEFYSSKPRFHLEIVK
jgi:hypothetical protein